MMKTKSFKGIISLMLCIVFVAAGMWIATEESSAISYTGKGNISWYNNVPQYSHSYKVIGEAYVVGSDNKVKTNSFGRGVHVDAYSAAEAGYPSKGNNVQNLYNLYRDSGATGNLSVGWPTNIAYYLCEGEKVKVIKYDDNYVYYWSPGFKSFGSSIYNCDQSTLLESHPAGVYRVKKSDVWLDIYAEREKAKSTSYVGKGQTLLTTVTVFQSLDMVGKAKCYAYPVNTEIKIVNSTPVTASNGQKYFKAVVRGDNAVGYFECNNFYVYVNEKYVNYHSKNVKIPTGYSQAKVEIQQGKAAHVFSSKTSTEPMDRTIFANNAKIKTYPKKSNTSRTCIWYDDKYAYIASKYVRYYVDELNIKTISNDKYVLSWEPVPVEVTLTAKENWKGSRIKINGKSSITLPANTKSYTLSNSVLYNYDGRLSRQGIEVTVQVKGDETYKGSHKLYCPEGLTSLSTTTPQNNKITIRSSWMGTQYGTILQYSTSSSFKNAKTVHPKGNYYEVKGLKKNTKYYFRAYNTFKVKTENGSKLKKGKVSKTFAVKTANISVTKPTIKTPSRGKKSLTVNWKKYTAKGSYHEVVVATNKSFTKNVQKAKPTKSLTSIRFSGLKSNKKYYVKMRTVYKYYGTEYKSGWSKIKTVKTK